LLKKWRDDDAVKRQCLEVAGWVVGDIADFLEFSTACSES
jgi:hypothetical protein